MKSLVLMVCFLSTLTPANKMADVPPEHRQHNWSAMGSCAHASVCTALRYHNNNELADWWRQTYRDSETIFGTIKKLTAAGVPFAYTATGDIQFLEWATRNRLCVILYHVPNGHCVNLVAMTETEAIILDNNNPETYSIISRYELEHQWLETLPSYAQGSGWALAILMTPPPPWPVIP